MVARNCESAASPLSRRLLTSAAEKRGSLALDHTHDLAAVAGQAPHTLSFVDSVMILIAAVLVQGVPIGSVPQR